MWDTRSQYVSNHDGDTVTYMSDLGRRVHNEAEIRLLGVFAPELSQPGGIECRKFVQDWHWQREQGHTWPFLVVTTQVWASDIDRASEKKTLARYIGTVTCIATNESLNVAISEYVRVNGWGGGIGA